MIGLPSLRDDDGSSVLFACTSQAEALDRLLDTFEDEDRLIELLASLPFADAVREWNVWRTGEALALPLDQGDLLSTVSLEAFLSAARQRRERAKQSPIGAYGEDARMEILRQRAAIRQARALLDECLNAHERWELAQAIDEDPSGWVARRGHPFGTGEGIDRRRT
jgi:hypothetical protein